jgi:hypothetical protein
MADAKVYDVDGEEILISDQPNGMVYVTMGEDAIEIDGDRQWGVSSLPVIHPVWTDGGRLPPKNAILWRLRDELSDKQCEWWRAIQPRGVAAELVLAPENMDQEPWFDDLFKKLHEEPTIIGDWKEMVRQMGLVRLMQNALVNSQAAAVNAENEGADAKADREN